MCNKSLNKLSQDHTEWLSALSLFCFDLTVSQSVMSRPQANIHTVWPSHLVNMIHVLNLVHFSVIYYLTNTALLRQWYTTWDKLSTPAFNASLALVTTANNGLDAACKESQENRMIAAHGYSGDCKRPPNRMTDIPGPEIFISLNTCLKQITKGVDSMKSPWIKIFFF